MFTVFPFFSSTYVRFLIFPNGSFSNILAFINYRADLFLVNLFLTPSMAGIYVVAIAITERLWLFSKAVAAAVLPRLSELHDREEIRRRLTPIVARWVLYLTILGGCALVPVVLYLLVPVFGAGYARAINAILLLMPGVVIGSQIKYSGLAIIFTQFKKQPQNKFGGQQVHYTFRKVSNYTVHRQIFQIKYILALNFYCVFY